MSACPECGYLKIECPQCGCEFKNTEKDKLDAIVEKINDINKKIMDVHHHTLDIAHLIDELRKTK